jgi:thioredoxin 1
MDFESKDGADERGDAAHAPARGGTRAPRRWPGRVALLAVAAWSLAVGCTAREGGAGVVALPAAEFSAQLGSSGGATLLDVRTPGEFAKGHLPRAVNVDWYGRDFDRRVAGLDRSKPVFVYCLSGSRSAEAARRLAAAGFRQVVDLAGGIIAWRAAGLPQADAGAVRHGMTRAQFDALVAGDKPVLVDFFAEWCIPCRQMRPWLEELARTRGADLRVERIDADDNQELLRELGIGALPTVELYRGGREVWRKTGLTTRDEALARIDARR